MKLEDQVCSLELAKRLKELGVKQESLFFWNVGHWSAPRLITPSSMGSTGILASGENFSALTVAELGEMLPPDTPSDKSACWMQTSEDSDDLFWDKFFTDENFTPHMVRGERTEADARAKMLIYLIENKLVKP